MSILLCFIVLLSSVFAEPGVLDLGGYGGLNVATAPEIYSAPAAYAAPAIAAVQPIAAAAAATVSKTEYHISHPPSVPKAAVHAIKTIQPSIQIPSYQPQFASAASHYW